MLLMNDGSIKSEQDVSKPVEITLKRSRSVSIQDVVDADSKIAKVEKLEDNVSIQKEENQVIDKKQVIDSDEENDSDMGAHLNIVRCPLNHSLKPDNPQNKRAMKAVRDAWFRQRGFPMSEFTITISSSIGPRCRTIGSLFGHTFKVIITDSDQNRLKAVFYCKHETIHYKDYSLNGKGYDAKCDWLIQKVFVCLMEDIRTVLTLFYIN